MLLKEEIELAVNRQKKLFDQHLSLTPREAEKQNKSRKSTNRGNNWNQKVRKKFAHATTYRGI